jgi:hypothetical protein
LPEDDSRDAKLGRLFHKYWNYAELDRSFLSPDQRDLLELSDRLLNDVLNRLAFEVIHAPSSRAGFNQKRHDDRHLQPLYHVEHFMTMRDGRLPGTADRVYIWPVRKAALVVDLKSGFAVVEAAELNLQLRGYAVLVDENFEVDDIYVAILQPRLWSPPERITLAHYDKKDIEQARRQIVDIIEGSEEKDAPLKAGESQCRFCKAKLNCKAFRAALALPVESFRSDDALSKAAREAHIERRLKECSDEQLEAVLEACKLASYINTPAHDEARDRIKAGKFTNFVLGKEYDLRSVSDVPRAIAMLSLSGIASREEILALCEFSLRDVEERYRDKRGGTWQAARDKINRILASVIEREPCKPKILPKKK